MTEHTSFTGLEGTGKDAVAEAVRLLRKPSVVRERCANISAAVASDRSPHFRLERARLTDVVRRVARLTQERFPGGEVPLHSRWRHFEAGRVDRKALLDARITDLSIAEQARTRIDLAVVSVLLDAGAGPDWRFTEPGTGRAYARSEGLAVASFHAFVGGVGLDWSGIRAFAWVPPTAGAVDPAPRPIRLRSSRNTGAAHCRR